MTDMTETPAEPGRDEETPVEGAPTEPGADEETPATEPEEEAEPQPIPAAVDAIRALGYDPDAIQALVITPTSVVAIDAQYPEPLTRTE